MTHKGLNKTFNALAAVLRLLIPAMLLGFLGLSGNTLSFAQTPEVKTEHVQARLLSRTTHIVPGQVLDLALQLTPDEGWHTYWKNPGDTGLATKINWQLPAGFKVGEIQWPIPERINYEGLINFGFHGETWLLTPVAVPFDITDVNDGHVDIVATAKWLVCREVCIPEEAELALRLPIAAYTADSDVYASSWSEGFEKAWAYAPPLREDIDADYALDETFRIRVSAQQLPVFSRQPTAFIAHKGLVANAAPPQVIIDNDDLWVVAEPDPYAGEPPEFASVLLVWEEGNAHKGIEIPVEHEPSLLSPAAQLAGVSQNSTSPAAGKTEQPANLLLILLFALLGGFILNAMPCVFPVLSLKLIGLIESGAHSDGQRRAHGLAYTLGVVLSFVAVAALLIALRATGEQIGWGFQLQSPLFVGALVYLLFVMGLSLSGAIELGGSLQNIGSNLASDSNTLKSSFFTGVLATVVATPCTAPFMGAAIGFALSQSALIALLVFVAMGLGLALPFLLVAMVPALASLFPRPGNWMLRFKEAMAFPLYLTVVWLLWVFSRQAGADAASALLVGLVLLAFAIWLWRTTLYEARRLVARGIALAAAGVALAILLMSGSLVSPPGSQVGLQERVVGENWLHYSPEHLKQALEETDTVFVNMTADWCITCKVNERLALQSDEVQAAFNSDDVQYIKGDWTNTDPLITAYLESFGRNGVPLYVVYKKGAEPEVLPQILTPDIVLDALDL